MNRVAFWELRGPGPAGRQSQTPPSQPLSRQRLTEPSDPAGSGPSVSLHPNGSQIDKPKGQTLGRASALGHQSIPGFSPHRPSWVWVPFPLSRPRTLAHLLTVPLRTPTPSWTSGWTASVPCTGWRSSPSSSTSPSTREQQRNSSRCGPGGWPGVCTWRHVGVGVLQELLEA